jgi:hypothetical protein
MIPDATDPRVLAVASALVALLRAAKPSTPPPAAVSAWIAPEASPLGKRRVLGLARAGVIASAKVNRKVLIDRASHEAYLAQHKRGAAAVAPPDEEDLFR